MTETEFYDASRVAVIPMGFCFPGLNATGGDLPPRKECAPRWHEQLFARLPAIELILMAGLYAQEWHLGRGHSVNLTENVRSFRACLKMRPRRLMPLPHPSWRNNAWLIHNPWFDSELLPRLRAEVRALL